ncbi:hypothetical protein BJ875DRAFT_473921 [Amylocarpus encephaloides]|uniref:Lysine decarboxylase-like protein n=1 Tax=Amylocarpus encephaloides TaxID=45428 RepID=A0A9P7YAN4_9HELO|nr:hypothetical protein BJ875DRAFT_473921 [Amylocarpus encephaloides]
MTSNGSPPTKIAVFCGASAGNSPIFMESARELATHMASLNIQLVYGGGNSGIMGMLAKTLVSLSGPQSVHGIIPDALVKYERDPEAGATVKPTGETCTLPDYEIYGYTEVVSDMHTRKLKMAQAVMKGGPGSGFIALAGGFGTFEELMEMATWNQLGIMDKGVVVLNQDGFWDDLFKWVDKSITAGFIKQTNRGIMLEARNAQEAVKLLKEYVPSPGRFKLQWGNE